MTLASHLPILPILGYILAGLLVPLLALRRPRASHALAVAAAAFGTATALLALREALRAEEPIRYQLGGWAPPMGIELVADPLSTFFALVVSAVALFALIHARRLCGVQLAGSESLFYSAALIMLGGFTGIVMTGDLFNLYVFLEISALSSYAVLGCGSARGAFSAFRYLLVGTVGASFYLLGVGFVLFDTGTLNMADLRAVIEVQGLSDPLFFGALFIVTGMAMKMALFPLHFWLPDAYASARSAGVALVAPIGTKVAAYVAIRALYDLFPLESIEALVPLRTILAVLACGGILWGSIMAIAQDDLKRMLAYSSVAQIGYIVLGIGLASAYGYIGAVLHVVNHACMKACLFLVSGNLEAAGAGQSIRCFDAALKRRLPWTSACFVLASLSMIGLPPTAGFFSKWYLLLGSYEAGSWAFVVVIIASSLLNAAYFFRVIERMYLRGKDDETAVADRPLAGSVTLIAPAVALAASLLALGLGNAYLVSRVIEPAVAIF